MEVFCMVSTKEILYVLLITLAATGGFYGDENYSMGLPYGALLPLLLLLLLSTDRPFVEALPQPCCPAFSPCPGRRDRGFGGGLGGFGGGIF
jgi:hypothetical protein